MAYGLNKCTLIGYVGRDATTHQTPGGRPVTSFTVAVPRPANVTDGTDRREKAEWFKVVTWNGLAGFCAEHVRTGERVYVEGRVHLRSWHGTDGKNHSELELTASEVLLLSPKAQDAEPEEELEAVPA
ncbi:MAG: single-stranded DNA-binding protein [Chloroflexota bacterium]|nr:single-stranded DNA-binding protein [Chloroflexota bacterium]